MAESAICWAVARFCGLEITEEMLLISIWLALFNPTLALARKIFNTDSSIRFSGISPLRTALKRPLYAPSRSVNRISMSLPALTVSIAACFAAAGPASGYTLVSAAISMASVIISPLNSSCCWYHV